MQKVRIDSELCRIGSTLNSKHEFLRGIGVEFISTSRDPEIFRTEMCAMVGERGVDVVLNSLTSEGVQIGAYQKYINAEKMNSNLRDKYSLVLSVELHNSLYRLLTHSFPNKKSAEEYLDVLQARFQISGFLNKF